MPNGPYPNGYPPPPPPPGELPAPPRPPPSDLQGLKELFERMESRLEGMPPPPPPVDYGPYYTPPPPVPPTVPDQGEWAEGMWEWYQATQVQRDAAYEARPIPPGPMTRMGEPPAGWPYLPQGFGRVPSRQGLLPQSLERLRELRYQWLPSPWSEYMSQQGEEPAPFWEWVQQRGWTIDPHWLPEAQKTQPLAWPAVGRMGAGGFAYHPAAQKRYSLHRYILPPHMALMEPTSLGGYRHEVGHIMETVMGEGGVLSKENWQEAVKRWRDDPQYPSGKDVWAFISGWPRGASEEKPGWEEAYADAAARPLGELPPYIRIFFPWRRGATASPLTRQSFGRMGLPAPPTFGSLPPHLLPTSMADRIRQDVWESILRRRTGLGRR